MSRESTPPPGTPPDVPDEEAIRSAVAALAKKFAPAPDAAAPEADPAPVSPREPPAEQLRSAPVADSVMATTRRVTIKRPSTPDARPPTDDEDIWVVPGSAAASAEAVASVTTPSGAPTRVAPAAASNAVRPSFRLSRWLPGVGVVLLVGIFASYWIGITPWQRDAGTPAGGQVADATRPRPAAAGAPSGAAPAAAAPAPSAPAPGAGPAGPAAAPAVPPAAAGSPAAPQIAGAPPLAAAPAPAAATRSADSARPAPPAALPTTSTPTPVPPMAPGMIAPTFDIARIAPDGRGVIAGRAAPGARVTVLDGERVLAAVDADARGEWVVVIDPPLAPGAHDLRLVQHRDGREIARSDRTITVDVPVRSGALTAPAAAGTSPQAGAAPSASLPLVVSTPAAGGPSTVIQAPGGSDALARSGKLVLGAVDYDEQGQLTVTGQAPAGTTVRVYVDNRVAGDATAGVDGRWTLQPADAIALGKRTVRIDQLGAGGGVTSRLEVPFERMTLARPGVVTIVRGDNLWNIARARYGDGQRYTVIYEANKNQIRDPNLIYPGQTFVIPKSLD